MKVVRSKGIYLILGIFIILCVFLIWNKSLNNKILDEVKLSNKENAISEELFAIMLGDEEGIYSESNSNTFPTDGYIYNEEKSGCIDIKGNLVEDIMTYDTTNHLVIVSTDTTVYCYLYFDIVTDKEPPTDNSVSINSGATYTTSTSVTLTLSSSGATEMCISNTSSCSDWEDYTTSKSWTLTTGDGTKTVYLWYRDEYGNTTSYVTDTIIVDTTAPTVTASASSNNTSSPKISITSNEAGTYCVNTTSTATNFSNCTLIGSISANTAITTSALSSTGTYYVHVKDSAGNVGGSSAVSIAVVKAAGEYIQSLKPTGLNTTMEGGLYRYQGTSVNNYICFGTSTKSTCTGNKETYMYRIIGINSSGQLKLIKFESLGNMEWGSRTTWPNSTIYKNINGSSFLTNTTYVPSGWSDKIATTSWKYGNNTTNNTTAANLYSLENAWTSTTSAKIGLRYLHDYYYAYQSGGLNCSSSGSYSKCQSSWIFISNDKSAAGTHDSEWTMSSVDTDSAWDTNFLGYSYDVDKTSSYNVRPVFYLISSVNFVSGTGTSSDPFIIS